MIRDSLKLSESFFSHFFSQKKKSQFSEFSKEISPIWYSGASKHYSPTPHNTFFISPFSKRNSRQNLILPKEFHSGMEKTENIGHVFEFHSPFLEAWFVVDRGSNWWDKRERIKRHSFTPYIHPFKTKESPLPPARIKIFA